MEKTIKNRGLSSFLHGLIKNSELPTEFSATDIQPLLSGTAFSGLSPSVINSALGHLERTNRLRRVRQGVYSKAGRAKAQLSSEESLEAALDALVTLEKVIRRFQALAKQLAPLGFQIEV